MILVDTSVWSLALRRDRPARSRVVRRLEDLVRDGRAILAGPILQELLSGIRDPRRFRALRDHLRPFPLLPIRRVDYETAAEHSNRCRARGIQGSTTDFLLCALSTRARAPLFTTDRDFERYATVLALDLYEPEA